MGADTVEKNPDVWQVPTRLRVKGHRFIKALSTSPDWTQFPSCSLNNKCPSIKPQKFISSANHHRRFMHSTSRAPFLNSHSSVGFRRSAVCLPSPGRAWFAAATLFWNPGWFFKFGLRIGGRERTQLMALLAREFQWAGRCVEETRHSVVFHRKALAFEQHHCKALKSQRLACLMMQPYSTKSSSLSTRLLPHG